MPPTRGISCLSLVLYGIRIGSEGQCCNQNLKIFKISQAVCFPYWYQEKVRRQTVRSITLQLLTPVVLLALLFNITKFIAISPLGTSSS